MEPITGREVWGKSRDKHDQQELIGEKAAQSTASHKWELQKGHDHWKGDNNDATEQSRNHQRNAKSITNQDNQVRDQQHQERQEHVQRPDTYKDATTDQHEDM